MIFHWDWPYARFPLTGVMTPTECDGEQCHHIHNTSWIRDMSFFEVEATSFQATKKGFYLPPFFVFVQGFFRAFVGYEDQVCFGIDLQPDNIKGRTAYLSLISTSHIKKNRSKIMAHPSWIMARKLSAWYSYHPKQAKSLVAL